MKLNFGDLKSAIHTQLSEMAEQDLFVTDVDKDVMWDTYLASFPEGSNPMFRKRTEHDTGPQRRPGSLRRY